MASKDQAATKIQGKARSRQAKATAASRKASSTVGSVFELFDTDKSGRLSALEFCAGIEVILERAETVEQKQAVADFVATSSTLWNLMSQDAGWGADIPVAQLPHCTPELWKKYLDANGDKDDAFLAFAGTFFKVAHQIKRRLLSQAIAAKAQIRLESTKRGKGDLFDLIDTDKSGALSVGEMENTLRALADEGVDTQPWIDVQVDLYMILSKSAGWGAMGAMNPAQLPHLTRDVFEQHMAEKKEQLAGFVAAVDAVMPKSATIQAAAAQRMKVGL